MATFLDRVNGMTRLGISATTNPSKDNLDQYLVEGLQDFFTRWTSINPQDIYLFARESLLFDGTGSSGDYDANPNFELEGGKILSVLREDGTALSFRNCRRVSYGLQDRVTDSDSLHFASAYNPAYFVTNDGIVNVAPAVGLTGSSYKVLYTNVEPVDEDASAEENLCDSSKFDYFPKDKEYAVVLYAAIRCVENKLSLSTLIEEDAELATMFTGLLGQFRADYNMVFELAKAKAAQPQGAA